MKYVIMLDNVEYGHGDTGSSDLSDKESEKLHMETTDLLKLLEDSDCQRLVIEKVKVENVEE